MYSTVEQIVEKVLIELGLVPGSSVQTYTEPQIRHNINVAFKTLFSKRFWPHLTKTTTHNLDGVVGVITDILVNVQSFDDIEWIRWYPFTTHETFVRLNGVEWEDNWRESFDQISYGDIHWNTKWFNVFPVTFAQPIKVRARRRQAEDYQTGIIPFDDIALTHLVASNMLASDGINPAASQRQLGFFEQRYTDLISNENVGPQYARPSQYGNFTVAE